MSMNRDEMIMYLHEFDSDLKMPVTLVVCGASAAILNHGLKRNSFDIDVMNTSVPLELLKESIEKVAKNHHFDHKWLNDDSKIIYTRLSKNYEVDTEIIADEKFKYLNVNVVNKPDFIITKLAYYDQIRNKDITDIKLIELGKDDVNRFFIKLDEISNTRQIDALKIESIFKQIRPELVKTLEGYSFHSENDIFDYCQQRYSFTPPDSEGKNMDLNYSNIDLEILYSKWKKLGWGVTGDIYPDEIDVEALIVETTKVARYDGRLFQWFRTWVCNYADLINKKRLIRFLDEADTAVLGAVLELAIEHGADPNFTVVIAKCRPYEKPQLLFKNSNELPFYLNQEINNSHPIYKKWGLYCSEVEYYTDALYTRDFVLDKNRILALRSVLGANIRAEILYNLSISTGIAIKKLSKKIGYSYSSVYVEVRTLIKSGFLSEKDEGRDHKLYLSTKGDLLTNKIINSLFVQ